MVKSRTAIWIGASAAVVLLVVAVTNWQTVSLMLGIMTAERRPGLLADAQWRVPTSAAKFNRKFGHGGPQGDLISWLQANRFKVDAQRKRAERLVGSLPCNELIEVKWSANQAGLIEEATVAVSEAGCL
jgi:hypothetical protein